MQQFQSYFICTSPRSGSTLLCKLLSESGVAGAPNSHFHTPSLSRWLEVYGLNAGQFTNSTDAFHTILAAAIERGKAGTDIFGLRLQRHSFDFFMEQLRTADPSASCDADCIERAFGKTLFVYLNRENKLDQAISYVKAKQSGLWHRAPDGTELERLSAPAAPVYDAQAITAQIEASRAMETAWEAWFATQAVEPLRLCYDALAADPLAVTGNVLTALGVSSEGLKGLPVPVAKLADATSRDWAERYLAETCG